MPDRGFDRRDEFVAAMRFLTRIPWPASAPPPALADTVWAFPVIGAALGLAGGGVTVVTSELAVPPLAAALLGLATTIWATGALHEDGLADTADGLGGGRDRQRKLDIMRDSRIGSYGALALMLSLGLRAAALSTLIAAGPGAVLGATVAAHAAARAGLPLLMSVLEPAAPSGLAASAGRPRPPATGIALLIGALAALIALGPKPALAALAAAAAALAALATLARRQIGGYTGDILGAAEQVVETAMLLAAAAAWQG
jgi:adenosylcobinamide-GDP ribazoletransferase